MLWASMHDCCAMLCIRTSPAPWVHITPFVRAVSFLFVSFHLPARGAPSVGDPLSCRPAASRHGGLCLGPGDTENASRVRQALRAAGVPLAAPEPVAEAMHEAVAAGGADAPPAPLFSRSSSRPSPSSVEAIGGASSGSGTAPSFSPGGGSGSVRCGAVVVVGEHGRSASLASWRDPDADGGWREGKDEDEDDDDGEGETWDSGARAVLRVEGRAEAVSLLWVEACHRGGELRRPGSCERVFRPQAWPIRTFSESCSSAAGTVGQGGSKGGGSPRRCPAIAVRKVSSSLAPWLLSPLSFFSAARFALWSMVASRHVLLGWLAVPLVSPFVLLCCEPFPHLCSRFFFVALVVWMGAGHGVRGSRAARVGDADRAHGRGAVQEPQEEGHDPLGLQGGEMTRVHQTGVAAAAAAADIAVDAGVLQ